MNSKNLVVGILLLILVLGGAYVIFKRGQRANPQPIPTSTVIENTPVASASAAVKKTVIDLVADKNATESGNATLTEENGKVSVELSLTGAPVGVAQPAHIHLGKCPAVGAVKYPLTNVVNGQSTTVLETTLDNLKSQLPLAINVHKSVPQSSVYVACGDLTGG